MKQHQDGVGKEAKNPMPDSAAFLSCYLVLLKPPPHSSDFKASHWVLVDILPHPQTSTSTASSV